MTRSRLAWVGLLLIECVMALGVHAAEPPSAPAGSDQVDELLTRYNLHPVFEKLGRGLGNTVGGWLEIPLNIQKRYTSSDAATSLLTGMAIGLVKGVVRTGVGLYEAVTFFIPYPENFAPILPTLEYFQQDRTKPRWL